MSRPARLLLAAILVLAGVAFAFTVVQYLNRPLRADEILLASQAKAIDAHGVPKLTFAEDRLQHVLGYYGYDAHYGMWHPPAYEYALATAVLVAGDHNWAYRSVGLLCLLASLVIVWRLSRVIAPRAPGPVRALAVALPLLSPLVMEGSLFVDLDNTTLLVSLVLVIGRFLRPGDPYTIARVVELSLLLCLTLLSKLTTPFVLMGCLALYAALRPQPLKGVLSVVVASVMGVVLFAILYWTYCRLLSYPARFMFDFSYLGKRDLYNSAKSLRNVLFASRWIFVWFSPVMAVLFVLVTWRRALNVLKTRAAEPIDLLVGFSVATFVCYGVVGALWGKYSMPAGFVGAAAIGLALKDTWQDIPGTGLATAGLALALMGLATLALPVPLVRSAGVDQTGALLSMILDARNVSAVLLAMLAIGLSLAVSRSWRRAGRVPGGVPAALAALVAVSGAISAVRVVSAPYDRGPYRPFEDRGFMATAAYLNRVAPEGAAVLAPKDLGYYTRGRYYGLEDLLQRAPASATAAVARRPDVRFIVDSLKYPVVLDRHLFDGVEFSRIETIGDYRVYFKK
jgi:hypothetical protein